MKLQKLLPLILLITIFNTAAYADVMMWPSLYIANGMLSIKVILAGLFLELLFVKYFTKIRWAKAGIITFTMNLVTCSLGIILIPLSGYLIKFIVPFTTVFHWYHWLLSYLLVILINTSLKGVLIKLSLKRTFKSVFWWLFIANTLCVLACIWFYGWTMQGFKSWYSF